VEIKKGNVIINIDEVIDRAKADVVKLNAEVLDMLLRTDNDLIYGYLMIALTKTKNAIQALPKEE